MSTIKYSLGLLSLFCMLLSGCIPGQSGQMDQEALQLRNELTSIYMHQYPEPILVSTNGEKLITKVRDPDLFALQVYDITTQDLELIDIAYYTQLSLTWGNYDHYVLYQKFNPETTAYALMRLNIGDSIRQEIKVPPSFSALPPLRPSPNDSMLAFVTVQNKSVLQVLPFDFSSEVKTIDEVSVFSDFVWKNDLELLYINLSQNTILQFNTQSEHKDTLYYNSNLEIKDLEIGPSGIISFTARDHTTPWVSGYILRGNNVEQITLDQNIYKFVILDSEYIVETIHGGEKKVLILDQDKQVLRSLPNATINRVSNHQLFLKVYAPDLPPQMIEYRSGKSYTLIDKVPLPPVSQHRILNIGGKLPAYLWKANQPIGKCMIDVHGGPHLTDSPYWDPGRYFLTKKGIHVITPNYRGSSGYTQTYEQETSLAMQVEDLVRTVAFARDSLNIDKENIYFIGRSYGAKVVQAYLLSDSHHQYGGWTLLGGALDTRSPFPTNTHNPTLAYYGRWDRQAPPNLKYLQNQDPRKVNVTIFDQEGHHFHRTDSQVEILEELIIDN